MTDRYKVVFTGKIQDGLDLESVKENLCGLFKTDKDRINRLLSNPPVAIKKDLDLATARKYQSAIEKVGAICDIEEMPPETEKIPVSQLMNPDHADRSLYKISFYGALEAGHDLDSVKKKLAELFKTDDAVIDQLLSSLPAVIKKGVDLDTATKYRTALKQVGAVCQIEPMFPEKSPESASIPSEKIPEDIPPPREEKPPSSPSPQGPAQEPPEGPPQEGQASGVAEQAQTSFFESSPGEESDQHTLQVKEIPREEAYPGEFLSETKPENGDRAAPFFQKLFHTTPAERREILKLVLGSAIVGAITGYFWGGLYDPWRSLGIPSAVLNFFLFGGWGLAEVMGLLLARNVGQAGSRKGLVFSGAFFGGIWVAFLTALNLVTDPTAIGGVHLNVTTGLIGGFITGGLISAICTIKLSGIMFSPPEEPGKEEESLQQTKRPSKGRKFLMGCSTGCLIIILILLAIFAFFIYKTAKKFETMEQGINASEPAKKEKHSMNMPDIHRQKTALFSASEMSIHTLLLAQYAPSELDHITSLDLSFRRVCDLTPLKDLKQLSSLTLTSTPVRDLTPLQDLKNLSYLDLSHTQVNDLNPLKNLSGLKSLNLGDTPVKDLTPLVNLKNLSELFLWSTRVRDLTPLKSLTNLTYIDLSKNQINEEELNRLKKALPHINIRL